MSISRGSACVLIIYLVPTHTRKAHPKWISILDVVSDGYLNFYTRFNADGGLQKNENKYKVPKP